MVIVEEREREQVPDRNNRDQARVIHMIETYQLNQFNIIE